MRIRSALATIVLALGLHLTAGVAPAHADHCNDHAPGAPETVTKAHKQGGIEVRVTYNYTTCGAYASLSNTNDGGLRALEMKLWSVAPGKCPSGGSNGLKLAEWSGTLEGHRIQTISATTPAGDCFRVTVWFNGYPWDGEQVFPPRF